LAVIPMTIFATYQIETGSGDNMAGAAFLYYFRYLSYSHHLLGLS
jgi:hypothetical protein